MWILIVGLVIWAILHYSNKEKQSEVVAKHAPEEKVDNDTPIPSGELSKETNMSSNQSVNSNEKIYNKVEQLEQKAEKLCLSKKVWILFEEIKNYPSWEITRPDLVCGAVGKVSAIGENKVAFNCDGANFEFSAKSEKGHYEDSAWSYIYLSLKKGSKKVFKVKMSDENVHNYSRWSSPEWKAAEIQTYFDGNWVESIIKLSDAIQQFNVESNKKIKNDEEMRRVKQLKKILEY